MSFIKDFEKIFNQAKKSSDGIKNYTFNPDVYKDDEEAKKGIRTLVTNIVKELSEKHTPRTDEITKMVIFAKNIKTESEFFDCIPPLGKGDVRFKDIAGLEDVKENIRISYIYPSEYSLLFPSTSKGILFYGPPGTGKTMLALAATAEIQGAQFYGPTPGEIKGRYVGETESNIRKLFGCAEKQVKESESASIAVIFFDEFDSIAGKKGDDPNMTNSVNALLHAMDGIKKLKNVSVIAATNYPRSIEDAILRRFTTKIFVDLPDKAAIDFLIRKSLATNYCSPNISKEDRIEMATRASLYYSGKGGKIEEQYLENIALYGNYENKIIKKEKGWIFGTSETTFDDKHIDNDYIKILIDKFGPTPEGKEIMDSKGKISSTDKRLEKEHIFGYSPSDIDKTMDIAIRYAASRALKGYANTEKIGTSTYYVYNSKITIKAKGKKQISELSIIQKKLVLNFDLYRSDILMAMEQYKSNIDNLSYIYLLNYSRGEGE